MDTKAKEAFLDRYLTPIAVLIGAGIIAAALAFGQGGAGNVAQQPGQQPPAQPVDIKDVKTDTGPYVGEKNAPVVMAVWFDYQCPYCKQLELTTMPQVYEQYVKTGKVRIVFKDFQFLDEYSKTDHKTDSMDAALFARAVWEAHPDRFYDWYIAMAEKQDDEFAGFGDRASIEALTRTIPGIDADRVLALLKDKTPEYTEAIVADRTEGTSLGINGTPAIIIGTTLLSGAQPIDKVAPLIDALLAKKK